MKKILAVLFAAMFLFSLCSCASQTEEGFHFDLIRKYQNTNGEMYYKDVIGGVEIIDFGVKYNAELYDIENSSDDQLTYYYKYEGSAAKTKGFADMKDYNTYLAGTFSGDTNSKIWEYTTENGDRILLTYVDLSTNAVGLIVSVSIPTNGIIGAEKHYNVVNRSDSSGE